MSTIRLAIAGVGNCASSLIQGLEYYTDADPADEVPGLMHVELGGYHIRDIELVAAFDVDAEKVGLDTRQGHLGQPATTPSSSPRSPDLGVTVQRGPTLDGFGEYYREDVRGVAGRAGRRRPGAARHAAPTCSCRTCRSAPRRPSSTTPRPASTPASPSSTPSPCSSPPTPSGPRSSPTPACRSSATTSRARSAPPSSTACWPACSRTAARRSTTPTS